MPFDPHVNLLSSLVDVAPSPATSGTTFGVLSANAARFPDPAVSGPYNLAIFPAGVVQTADNTEFVRVTAKSGATPPVFTITRAQEGSSARAITVGDVVQMVVTAKTLTDVEVAQATEAFSAYRATTVQSIPNATYTKVQLNAEDWDVSGRFDSVTNYRYTPQRAGYYLFTSGAFFNDTLVANSTMQILLYKNGVSVRYLSAVLAPGTAPLITTGSGYAPANGTTDYFEMFVYQANGAAKNLGFGSPTTYFQGSWVGGL